MSTDKRIENKTSRTAEWTCASRAVSALETDSCYRGNDYIAPKLVPVPVKLLLHLPLFRTFFRRVLTPRGIYEYTIARTKYIDAIFREILLKKFDQVLVFGAGFDTRALRFQNEAENTIIFELDAPVTQQAKLQQYQRRGFRLPANTRFIEVNFERESLAAKLAAAGFKSGRRSFFLLEGLLMYLQPAAVDEIFQVIGKLAGEKSEIVFDYVRASVLRQEGTYYGEREIVESVAKAGEQWYFGMERTELEHFLAGYGWKLRDHKDARELEKTYFTDATGTIVGRVNDTHCLVRAIKI